MFGFIKMPGVEDAQKRAEGLVGKEALAATLEDRVIQDRIRQGIAFYRTIEAIQIPKLLLPKGMVIGRMPSGEKLVEVVRGEFMR